MSSSFRSYREALGVTSPPTVPSIVPRASPWLVALQTEEAQTTPSVDYLVDIGANLTNKRFDSDLDIVIQRSLEADVRRIIVTGTSIPASIGAIELSKQYPSILCATVGVHPHEAKHFDPVRTPIEMRRMIAENSSVVVAIGECGLDFDRNFSSREDQMRAFRLQIDLAIELQLPLFLHERAAHEEFCEVWNEYRARPNVKLPPACVHCFTGTKEALERYLAMGFHIGITGWICDERRGSHLQRIVHLIPWDKLMIETDAPYLVPKDALKACSSSGKPLLTNLSRNEPALLPLVAKKIAECRDVDVSMVVAMTTTTALRFFRL